jgi:hypothetical protein
MEETVFTVNLDQPTTPNDVVHRDLEKDSGRSRLAHLSPSRTSEENIIFTEVSPEHCTADRKQTSHSADLSATNSLVNFGIMGFPSYISKHSFDPISDDGQHVPKELDWPLSILHDTTNTNPDLQPQDTDYFNTLHRRKQFHGIPTPPYEGSPTSSEYMIRTPEDVLTPQIIEALETLAMKVLAFPLEATMDFESLTIPSRFQKRGEHPEATTSTRMPAQEPSYMIPIRGE